MLDEPIHTPLTDEQATQAARLLEAFLALRDAGICPQCKGPIEREIQRSRCVYAEPHRRRAARTVASDAGVIR